MWTARASVGMQARVGWMAEAICHVHHIDLVTDPVSTVEQVYRHFGLHLPRATAHAMARYSMEHPNGGYGPRDYRFEDHRLNVNKERVKFRPYMLRFGISPEALLPPRPTERPLVGSPADRMGAVG